MSGFDRTFKVYGVITMNYEEQDDNGAGAESFAEDDALLVGGRGSVSGGVKSAADDECSGSTDSKRSKEEEILAWQALLACPTAVLASLGHGAIAASEIFKLFNVGDKVPLVWTWVFAFFTSISYRSLEMYENREFIEDLNNDLKKPGVSMGKLMIEALKKTPYSLCLFVLGSVVDGIVAFDSTNELNGTKFEHGVSVPTAVSAALASAIGISSLFQFFIVEGTKGREHIGWFGKDLFKPERDYLGKQHLSWKTMSKSQRLRNSPRFLIVNFVALIGSLSIAALAFNSIRSTLKSLGGVDPDTLGSYMPSAIGALIYLLADFSLYGYEFKEFIYGFSREKLHCSGEGIIPAILFIPSSLAVTLVIMGAGNEFIESMFFCQNEENCGGDDFKVLKSFWLMPLILAGLIRGGASYVTEGGRFIDTCTKKITYSDEKYLTVLGKITSSVAQFFIFIATKILLELTHPEDVTRSAVFTFALPAFFNDQYASVESSYDSRKTMPDSLVLSVIYRILIFGSLTGIGFGLQSLIELIDGLDRSVGVDVLIWSDIFSAVFTAAVAVAIKCAWNSHYLKAEGRMQERGWRPSFFNANPERASGSSAAVRSEPPSYGTCRSPMSV